MVIVVVIVVIYFLVIKKPDNGGGGGGGGDSSNSKRALIETRPFFTGLPIHSRIVGRDYDSDAIAQMTKLMRERMHLPQLPA